MILVDSSVWIDYLRGTVTPETDCLDKLIGVEAVIIGDLILAEVLQGIDQDREFDRARRLLAELDLIDIGGADIALQAARNFRKLRKLGVTIRKTIDCMIATRCIANGYRLLHRDRGFDPFERHLGLRVVRAKQ